MGKWVDVKEKQNGWVDAAAEEELDLLGTVAGGIRSFGQGSVPFYDELTGGLRSVVDPSTYGEGRDLGERYDLAVAQERGQLKRFEKENPGSAMMIETAAGFNPLNPINKAGPVTQMGGGLVKTIENLGQNIARNATEASIFGLGEGEGEQRWDNMVNSAATAATVTGALQGLGLTAKKVMDMGQLTNPLRDPTTGEFTPTHISNPDSVRGWVNRRVLNWLPGANQNLAKQQQPSLDRVDANVMNVDDTYARQEDNLKSFQVGRETDFTARKREAENAIPPTETVNNVNYDAEDIVESQARLNSEKVLNTTVLRESVPKSRRKAITEGGIDGYNQAKKQINEAYDEAWGDVGSLKAGTLEDIIAEAEEMLSDLNIEEARSLKRLIANAEKLYEEGGNPNFLDRAIRTFKNNSKSFELTESLGAIREMLRKGLPEENVIKLKEVDDIYPNFLTIQKATAAADDVNNPGGLVNPSLLTRASKAVGGEQRTAAGKRPLKRTIDAGSRPELDTSNRQAAAEVEKARVDQVNQKRASRILELKRANQDEQSVINRINSIEKANLAKAKKSALEPVKEAQKEMKSNAVTGSGNPYAALRVSKSGSALPINKLSDWITREGAQEFVAGQGKKSQMLADYLRSGRSEYLTRAAARTAARLAYDEEQE